MFSAIVLRVPASDAATTDPHRYSPWRDLLNKRNSLTHIHMTITTTNLHFDDSGLTAVVYYDSGLAFDLLTNLGI